MLSNLGMLANIIFRHGSEVRLSEFYWEERNTDLSIVHINSKLPGARGSLHIIFSIKRRIWLSSRWHG